MGWRQGAREVGFVGNLTGVAEVAIAGTSSQCHHHFEQFFFSSLPTYVAQCRGYA